MIWIFTSQGDDDEAIQLQRVRAEEGDVPAMIQMGDLHYFGARGLPRDQPRALEYYNRAAAARNAHGMCCVAAMYLKGEGMDAANGTRAVELYTEAAGMGSVKALNGVSCDFKLFCCQYCDVFCLVSLVGLYIFPRDWRYGSKPH